MKFSICVSELKKGKKWMAFVFQKSIFHLSGKLLRVLPRQMINVWSTCSGNCYANVALKRCFRQFPYRSFMLIEFQQYHVIPITSKLSVSGRQCLFACFHISKNKIYQLESKNTFNFLFFYISASVARKVHTWGTTKWKKQLIRPIWAH